MNVTSARSSRAGGKAETKPAARRPSGGLTLTEQAYVELEELISTLQLPPGAFLSEMALAQQLGFGRTPIREALQRLARDGLVVVAPRRGILVSEINLKAQLRLLETRRVLESLLARLAAERGDAAERARFAELARGMRAAAEASDDIAFMRLDRDFNQLVVAAARNEFAARAMANMTALSRRFWYQHYREVGDLSLSATLHAEVAEAIAARDAAAAAAASDRLMDYIESFARKTLDV
ncbi:GntR family transcriptional regulator [Hansschlegelia sp.]|uniref:GntR family transcriptional regulator n=1 Tax=Hansschlegelia sp. TaxID=2041892 RepID=UPI002C4E5BF0|nr:GntR family transcriptional regulator [Hansschlegelia sp.]HVI28718.1 GntR family transcriptional regulator [Hansschlegelia sp.]